MPRKVLSPEEFARIEDAIIQRAPAGLSPEQLDTRIDAALRNAEGEESRGSAIRRSLADTGLRTLSGVVKGASAPFRDPTSLVTGPYELGKDLLTNRGAQTRETLAAIASGDPDIGGQVIGGLLLGKFAPKVPVRRIVKTAGAATVGGAARIPVVGPIAKGAIRAGRAKWRETAPQPRARVHEGELVPDVRMGADDILEGIVSEAPAARALPPHVQRALPPAPREPLVTPPPADVSGVSSVRAGRVVARDPGTGRMRRAYSSDPAETGTTRYQQDTPRPEPTVELLEALAEQEAIPARPAELGRSRFHAEQALERELAKERLLANQRTSLDRAPRRLDLPASWRPFAQSPKRR